MSGLLWLLAAVVVAVAVDTAWVAWLGRAPAGRWRLERDAPAELRFSTREGRFVVDRAARRLVCTADGRRRELGFDAIRGLEYRAEERGAVLAELFFGFDAADRFGRWQDTIDWFSIAVVTQDRERVPVLLSGAYRRREFALGWYIDMQEAMLERLGLATDVEASSRALLDAMAARMPGVRLL